MLSNEQTSFINIMTLNENFEQLGGVALSIFEMEAVITHCIIAKKLFSYPTTFNYYNRSTIHYLCLE